MDKIPNTRCFNCLCKVNGEDGAPRGRRSTTRALRESLTRCHATFAIGSRLSDTCRTQKFYRMSGDRWRERDVSETADETTTSMTTIFGSYSIRMDR